MHVSILQKAIGVRAISEISPAKVASLQFESGTVHDNEEQDASC